MHSASENIQHDQSSDTESNLAATLAKQTSDTIGTGTDLHEKSKPPSWYAKHDKKEAAAAKAEARRDAKTSLMKKQTSDEEIGMPADEIKLDAADEEINAWLRQQPQSWLKEQLRLAVDEHQTASASSQHQGSSALVCVSLVATATDEWCSSFCAEHSCPESMCKCEGGSAAL